MFLLLLFLLLCVPFFFKKKCLGKMGPRKLKCREMGYYRSGVEEEGEMINLSLSQSFSSHSCSSILLSCLSLHPFTSCFLYLPL